MVYYTSTLSKSLLQSNEKRRGRRDKGSMNRIFFSFEEEEWWQFCSSSRERERGREETGLVCCANFVILQKWWKQEEFLSFNGKRLVGSVGITAPSPSLEKKRKIFFSLCEKKNQVGDVNVRLPPLVSVWRAVKKHFSIGRKGGRSNYHVPIQD